MGDDINWDEIGRKISDYLKLLELGAYASMIAVTLGVICVILLAILVYRQSSLIRLTKAGNTPPIRKYDAPTRATDYPAGLSG
jgi:hypothetical protein